MMMAFMPFVRPSPTTTPKKAEDVEASMKRIEKRYNPKAMEN
jgi:hypothetical protein